MSNTELPEHAIVYGIRNIDFTNETKDLSESLMPSVSIEPDVAKDEAKDSSLQNEEESGRNSRFEEEHLLGSGAYGEVWRVRDHFVERAVAVKKLLKSDPKIRSAVKREASLGARVSHPGTPTIYDILVDDDGHFSVIMEYMEGEGLDKVIDRLKMGDAATHQEYTFQVRANILLQLLRVLVSSHASNIVHCDIKPANIVIGPSKEVFLCDWGIALELGQEPRKRVLGTPNYIAPEQVSLKGIDARADLFSVAALAYQFLSLSSWHPYSLDLKNYLLEKLEYEPKQVDRISHPIQGCVPSEYKSWVHKGLQINPEQRFQTAEEMLCELELILSGHFCAECPRTFIKHWVFQYFKLLDRRPERVIVGTAVLSLAVMGSLIGLGIYLG